MPVPKRKRSHSRIAKAHANKGFKIKAFTSCATCNAIISPHTICVECRHYKGFKVLRTRIERAMARGEVLKIKTAREAERQKSLNPEATEQV